MKQWKETSAMIIYRQIQWWERTTLRHMGQ